MRSYRQSTYLTGLLIALVCFCLPPAAIWPQGSSTSDGGPISINKCWETASAAPVDGPIASDRETIFIPLTSGGIDAVNVRDGRILWSADLGGKLGSKVLVTDEALYVVSVSSGTAAAGRESAAVRSISKPTGITNWRKPLAFSAQYFLGSVPGGIIAAGNSGQIEFFSSGDGSTIWKMSVPGVISAEPFYANDKMLFGSNQKAVFVLSAANGSILSRTPVKHVPTAVTMSSDGEMIVGDERGNLALYDGNRNLQWNFKNGARISYIEHTKHGILAASFDNFLYLLSSGSGSVIWKRRLPGRLSGQPAVSAELAVASTIADGTAYFMEMESGKLINQLIVDNGETGGSIPLLIDVDTFGFSFPNGVRLFSRNPCHSK